MIGGKRAALLFGRDVVASILGAGGADYAYFDFTPARAFQDAAGATPGTAGQPVGLLNAVKKSGYSASQATSGLRPVLQTHGADFTAATPTYLTSNFTAAEGEHCIIVHVTVPNTQSVTNLWGGAFDATPANRFYVGTNASGVLIGGCGSQNPSVIVDATAEYIGNRTVVAAISISASLVKLLIDEREAYSAARSGNPTTSQPCMIGAANQGTPANPTGGRIFRIAFGRRAISLAEFVRIRTAWLS